MYALGMMAEDYTGNDRKMELIYFFMIHKSRVLDNS